MLTNITSNEVHLCLNGPTHVNPASPVIAEIMERLAALSRKFTELERTFCQNPSAGRGRPLVGNLYLLGSAIECLLEEHRRAVLGYIPQTSCQPQTPEELRDEALDLLTRALENLRAQGPPRVIDATAESQT